MCLDVDIWECGYNYDVQRVFLSFQCATSNVAGGILELKNKARRDVVVCCFVKAKTRNSGSKFGSSTLQLIMEKLWKNWPIDLGKL